LQNQDIIYNHVQDAIEIDLEKLMNYGEILGSLGDKYEAGCLLGCFTV
jgi:hypothetical protein